MPATDLYQETILDHAKRPRNFRKLEGASRHAEGYNPLCGDRITVYLKMENGRVADASFQGSGCAISTASASIMTESLKGKSLAEAESIFERFHELLTKEQAATLPQLGKLAVFAGVREFPMRVKCATLAWHTMRAALEGANAPVTTEEETGEGR
jgi:nitrogen fixation NifU-like protein